MINLTATADLVQVTTTQAINTDLHASWVTLDGTTVTAGFTDSVPSTAATFTLVAGPSSGQRNVKQISIYNRDASITQGITVKHFDNANSRTVVLMVATLGPGESLHYEDLLGWTKLNASGVQITSPINAPGNIQTFSATGTWNRPTHFTPTKVRVQLWGGGGGGGGASDTALGTAGHGGGGGGGGSYSERIYDAADVGSSQTVTLDPGGAGGSGGGSPAGDGTAAGSSHFGTLQYAYGGGGGRGGSDGAVILGGGGGASSLNNGATAAGTAAGVGGVPTSATLATNYNGCSGSAAPSAAISSEYGGAGGSGLAAIPAVNAHGGDSIMGGCGGGAGGSKVIANTIIPGGIGGGPNLYATGGGTGTPGTDGASPTTGGTGNAATSTGGGGGGGGGGTTITAGVNGGTGGRGGTGGGGGGGGGAATTGVGGTGGQGGSGYCIVTCW